MLLMSGNQKSQSGVSAGEQRKWMKLLIVITIKLRYCNTATGTKHSINLIYQDPECTKVIIKMRERESSKKGSYGNKVKKKTDKERRSE